MTVKNLKNEDNYFRLKQVRKVQGTKQRKQEQTCEANICETCLTEVSTANDIKTPAGR